MDKCAFCERRKPMCMGFEGNHFGVYKGIIYKGEHRFSICEECWEKLYNIIEK
jgi:hypothetical protein